MVEDAAVEGCRAKAIEAHKCQENQMGYLDGSLQVTWNEGTCVGMRKVEGMDGDMCKLVLSREITLLGNELKERRHVDFRRTHLLKS